MKKKFFFIISILLILLYAGYRFLYQEHRTIADESVSYTETATSIFTYYTKDEIAANAKFLDKTVLVKGIVTDIDLRNKSLVLDQKLNARFVKDIPNNIGINDSLTVKGRVIGFDSLMEEVKLDECSLP